MASGSTGLQNATDSYTFWSFPKSVYVTLNVLNNGVDVGFGKTSGAGGPEAANYQPTDEYFPPGSLIRPDSFDAIRIKNHVAGSVAVYSIATRLAEDIPKHLTLGASFTPNYLSVDPVTGAVGATFTGLVKALGLILQAGTANSPPNTSRVIWQRQSDGATVASIFGTEVLNRDILQLAAQAAAGGNLSRAQLIASSLSGTNKAGITADGAADSGGTSSVTAFAGATAVTLVDDTLKSAFPQLPANLKTRDLWGRITSTGAISGTSSGGFTITKGAAGIFTVNFTTVFADAGYEFTATLVNAAGGSLTVSAQAAGSIQVNTFGAGGAAADLGFLFRAIGAA